MKNITTWDRHGKKMVTRVWKVPGSCGSKMCLSYEESFRYDFTNEKEGVLIIDVECSDITGTNDYVIVRITTDSAKKCKDELRGQISDGIFENLRTGRVVEIK